MAYKALSTFGSLQFYMQCFISRWGGHGPSFRNVGLTLLSVHESMLRTIHGYTSKEKKGLQQCKLTLLDWGKCFFQGEITFLLKAVSLRQSGLIQSSHLKDFPSIVVN